MDKYDVLIADASEINTLSNAELAGIQAQITQHGMGLIVKEDTLLKASFLSSFPAKISTDTLQQLIPQKTAVNKIWFFILFTLCCSFFGWKTKRFRHKKIVCFYSLLTR